MQNKTKIKRFSSLNQSIYSDNSRNLRSSPALPSWVSKSVKLLRNKGVLQGGVSSKRFHFDGMVVNNSLYRASPNIVEAKMEGSVNDSEICRVGEENRGSFLSLKEVESGESSSSMDFLSSEVNVNDENSSSENSFSAVSMGWPMQRDELPHSAKPEVFEGVEKPHLDSRKLEKQGSSLSELDMMNGRLSKLLLGEDMSGCGNGVSTALAISNAITNLCATLFGQVWRLEPLATDKKSMWRREMEWLLCVSDHIVELIPSWQTFPDGSKQTRDHDFKSPV